MHSNIVIFIYNNLRMLIEMKKINIKNKCHIRAKDRITKQIGLESLMLETWGNYIRHHSYR